MQLNWPCLKGEETNTSRVNSLASPCARYRFSATLGRSGIRFVMFTLQGPSRQHSDLRAQANAALLIHNEHKDRISSRVLVLKQRLQKLLKLQSFCSLFVCGLMMIMWLWTQNKLNSAFTSSFQWISVLGHGLINSKATRQRYVDTHYHWDPAAFQKSYSCTCTFQNI